jgi:Rrf2 family protein
MKMSAAVEWALHCCVALADVAAPVPVAKLAHLHDVSSTYLAKQMQTMARGGLVRSVQGKAGGYVLTRAPEDITVLDVVLAIEGPAPAFECTEIRQRGPLATPPEDCARACPVARAMLAGEAAWRAALKAISIRDLRDTVGAEGGEQTLAAVHQWFARPLAQST